MAARFVIGETNSGRYKFQLIADSGELLLVSSNTYDDKKDALDGISSLKSSRSEEVHSQRVSVGDEVIFVLKPVSADIKAIVESAEIPNIETEVPMYGGPAPTQYVRESITSPEAMTLARHIEMTPGVCGGKPRIAGRRVTVQNIAALYERLGISIDEIAREFDLSLAEVHAALSFFHDNRSKIERNIARGEEFVKEFMSKHPSRLKQLFDER